MADQNRLPWLGGPRNTRLTRAVIHNNHRNRLDRNRERTLEDILPASACADIDATLFQSYPGNTQDLRNLVKTPADDADQFDYDIWRGIDGSTGTDEPTFEGPMDNPPAAFDLDGGDYFRVKDLSAATALANAHRTDTGEWWAVFCIRPTTNLIGFPTLMGNSWEAADIGILLYVDTNGDLRLWQADGTSSVDATLAPTGSITLDEDYCIIISCDLTSPANNARAWVNGGDVNESTIAFETTTAAPTQDMNIMATDNVTASPQGLWPNGTKFYSFGFGNAFIGDAEADKIFELMRLRHQRLYS